MIRSLCLILLPLLAGCSPSFGGSSPPPQVIVVPPGSTAVCPNGTAPPCQ